MIKSVVFDIDNTMYNFKSGNQAGMAALCQYAACRLDCSEGEFLDIFGKGKKLAEERVGSDTAAIHNRLIRMQVILELMGKPLFPHALNLYHCYWDALLAEAKPEPGLLEAMAGLKAGGVTLGVGTDMTAYIQYKKLEKLGAASYIDYITTSEEVGAEKPHPRLFHECIRKAGVRAGECLFIGDSPAKDVQGAVNAGMQAFLYAPALKNGGEAGMTVLTSFYDLPRMVRELDAVK